MSLKCTKLDPSWTRGDCGNPGSSCLEFCHGGLLVFSAGQRRLFAIVSGRTFGRNDRFEKLESPR